MAKSKARKKRDHIYRTTGKDVTKMRGMKPDFSTHERKTKTKREILMKMEKKHKGRSYQYGNDKNAFFYEKR